MHRLLKVIVRRMDHSLNPQELVSDFDSFDSGGGEGTTPKLQTGIPF